MTEEINLKIVRDLLIKFLGYREPAIVEEDISNGRWNLTSLRKNNDGMPLISTSHFDAQEDLMEKAIYDIYTDSDDYGRYGIKGRIIDLTLDNYDKYIYTIEVTLRKLMEFAINYYELIKNDRWSYDILCEIDISEIRMINSLSMGLKIGTIKDVLLGDSLIVEIKDETITTLKAIKIKTIDFNNVNLVGEKVNCFLKEDSINFLCDNNGDRIKGNISIKENIDAPFLIDINLRRFKEILKNLAALIIYG